jgi:hypothetical protein
MSAPCFVFGGTCDFRPDDLDSNGQPPKARQWC